tara:strand:- start:1046 stop:1219 length:174 start_codon:yes stop_codon:yes gene_type:complete
MAGEELQGDRGQEEKKGEDGTRGPGKGVQPIYFVFPYYLLSLESPVACCRRNLCLTL